MKQGSKSYWSMLGFLKVPGRKTDVQDYQWIQQLHSYGLLRGSFRPSIANLLQKSSKGFSRAISDVGWGIFLNCLKYKAGESGKYVIEVGKYFPSSQICASCDHQQKMPLFVREYDCPNCGVKRDRDDNSAIVLKAAGMAVLKARGAVLV